MPILVAAFALLVARQDAPTAAILAGARKVAGAVGGAWRAEGMETEAGIPEPWTMAGDGGFAFWRRAEGAIPDAQGYDGTTGWTDGPAGLPHPMVRADLDLARIVAYVMDGAWSLPGAPLRFRRLPDADGAAVLEVRTTDGEASARLSVDAKTFLPARLVHWGPDGEDTWTFAAYRRFGAATWPTQVEHRGGGDNQSFVVRTVERTTEARDAYRMPPTDETRSSFDAKAPAEVEVKRIGGYLFVRPRLDDREVGWFFFDTGADCLVLDAAVAKRLGEKTIGKQATAGVVATTELPVCAGTSFALGPLTLRRPTYLVMDLGDIAKAFSLPIAGICGYDAIGRADWDIDPARDRIGVYAPGKAPLPAGAAWTPFSFVSNVPNLRCGFEGDRTGLFDLDTGSGSAVDFFTPAVAKYGLLKDRKVAATTFGGVGGAAAAQAGTVAWFELAGRRFERVPAGFQLTQKGVFASPFFDGNVGMGLLGAGRLVLDYRNARLAFVKP